MSGGRRAITVTIHRDGALTSASYRIPLLRFRIGLAVLVTVGLVLVLGIAFYGPIARAAARVPNLEREVGRLRSDNEKIRQLAAALDSAEANYAQLRRMVGADLVPDPVRVGSALPIAPAIVVRPRRLESPPPAGASIPRRWPLDQRGYLTRGQVVADSADGAHPGIDLAVPVGALVRAAGGGTVLEAGNDREYGYFVLLQHPDGYQTMYGHLSRIVVEPGRSVGTGEVLGRSGNTGRSSAPHLHFEVRRNGVSIDPLTLVREGEGEGEDHS
jgi:murein DD-endopeptidase MepM/ murein hydrolase activator NlpD